jgi:hypothetical protein
MASDLPPLDAKANAFTTTNRYNAIWPEGNPTQAPRSRLSWGLFIPLVFACNVAVATLAWIVVGSVMR